MKKGSQLGPVRRRTVEDEVYHRLREAILKGDMAGGTRLVHEDLANSFGTSRIPVRDALKRLTAEGLVDTDERGICRVSHCGIEDVEEIYSLRQLLEAHAVALAVPRLDASDLNELERLQEEMDEAAAAADAESYVTLNHAFHRLLYESADQPRLLRFINSLWQGLPPLTPMTLENRMTRSNREHRTIIERLRAGDAQGAAAAMREHIATAGSALHDYVASKGGGLR